MHVATLYRTFLVDTVQPTVKNLINGEFTESSASSWIDVTNPARPPETCAL